MAYSELQGYLLSRPVPQDKLEEQLLEETGNERCIHCKPGSNGQKQPDHQHGGMAMTLSSNREPSPHLDPAVLDDLQRQMPCRPGILIRIIHSFLRASPDLLAALKSAIRARDPEAVRQAAHAMKSSNGQIGAKQLAAMCYELELLGSLDQLLDAAELLAELEQEYRYVEEELGVILAKLQSETDEPAT